METKVQSLFIAPTGNTNLAFNFEVGDPRNYKQKKTFYLPNVYKKDYQISRTLSCELCRIYNRALTSTEEKNIERIDCMKT